MEDRLRKNRILTKGQYELVVISAKFVQKGLERRREGKGLLHYLNSLVLQPNPNFCND